MKKFSLLADVLFYAVCAFLFPLCLLRYFRAPLWLSVLVSVLLSLAAGAVAFLVLGEKSRKKIGSKREREAREALLLHLALERPERVRAALVEAYSADGREAHCEGDVLSVDGVLLVPLFAMEPVSADEIARLIRKYGQTPFGVACNALTPDAEKLLSTFGRGAERGEEIYALFSRTHTTPFPLICGELPRKTIKSSLKNSFSKTNARPFFVSGLILLTMSLFTLFPLYYLVAGSILLGASVLVRLFGFAPA